MFYGQCNKCGERWALGTASTCTCPDLVTWVGLTDEEVEQIADSEYEEAFVRLVEAKLKEKNHG